MKPLLESHRAVRVFLFCTLLPVVAGAAAAESTRDSAAKASNAARSGTAARGGTGGKVLPDPALLDGSNQPAEKKSDYGMIGDFELPGDENASRTGKVGGGAGGKGGGTEDGAGGPSVKVTPPGLPGVGLPVPGQNGAGGGAPGAGTQNEGQGQGGAGSPNPGAAAGQQGGQPGGVQVGQLGGEGSPGQGAESAGERPRPVVIGDAAMRIPSSTTGVGASAGQVPAAVNTQNYEKGTGTGGKASGQVGGANRAEKGRPIPAGL